MLQLMGIPPDRVLFYQPDETDTDIPELRPDFRSPPLTFPEKYQARLQGGNLLQFLEDAFKAFNVMDGITDIVWIHIGHGAPNGLAWPQATRGVKRLGAEDLADLFSLTKLPIIMIVDACHSSTFIKEKVRKLVDHQQVAFLTSCDMENSCSLALISSQPLSGFNGFTSILDREETKRKEKRKRKKKKKKKKKKEKKRRRPTSALIALSVLWLSLLCLPIGRATRY
jgi:hypothetical protein